MGYKTLFTKKEFKRYITLIFMLTIINLIYIKHLITFVSIRIISTFQPIKR
jgi:hypothetical protein